MLLGHRLLVSLLKTQSVVDFYKAKLTEDYFVGDEVPFFNFVESHLDSHGCLPDVGTATESVGELPQDVPEPYTFYLQKVELRFGHTLYNKTLKQAADFLKHKDIPAITTLLEGAVNRLRVSANRTNVMDFAVDGLEIFSHSMKEKLSHVEGLRLGWPSLDGKTNGLMPGDVVTVIGRPASGKSFCSLFCGYDAYFTQGKNVLFLSMEMSITAITNRLIGLASKANLTALNKGLLSKFKGDAICELMSTLKEMPNKFWIADGNLKSTVQDIKALISQLKPDLVIIDGAYLMKSQNSRLDRFSRVAENIEALKQLAETAKVVMLLSYQFNREASKKNSKGEEPTLDDIGYSDAVGQISSVVLGLMQEESSETMNTRTINVMKGRDGHKGKFTINWNFDAVDFSEVGADANDSMQFD